MEKRILLIDDLPFMRTILREILEKAEFKVCAEAEDGMDGVISFIREKPDAVLLDIAMPVMDGITALRKMMEYDPKARIVMCSALGEEEMIVRAIQRGARDFIVKPFQPERVVSSLRKVLKIEDS
jgi:two-component system chemotaxis response regulator CheY